MKKSELKSLIKECIKELNWKDAMEQTKKAQAEKQAKYKQEAARKLEMTKSALTDVASASGKFFEVSQFTNVKSFDDIKNAFNKRPDDITVSDEKPSSFKWGYSTYLVNADGSATYVGGDEDSSG
jgi:sensor c-di-GMP phosphodiesterase-like protein